MKKLAVFFILFALVATVVAACGASTPPAAGGAGDTGNTVHMSDSNFVQSTITIKKGQSLNLVNDVSAVHIIQNGSWDSSGAPKSAQEAGAPSVQAVTIQGGGSQAIGPFTTSGTFHLYCTVHPGMNLTVTVQ